MSTQPTTGTPTRFGAILVLVAVVAVQSLVAACAAAAPAPRGSAAAAPASVAASTAAEAATPAPTPYKIKKWPSPTAEPLPPSAAEVYPGVKAANVEASMIEGSY